MGFQSAHSQVLNFDVNGNWNYSIPASDIIEAGNDFSGTYTSAASQISASIYLGGGWIGFWWNFFINYSWQVEVSRSDIDWDTDLQLFIRRTGNGNGYGGGNYITGGTNFMEVTNTNQLFFQGARARLNVPIQLQIKNVSVTMPAKTYSTTVVYTITSTF